MIQQKHDVKLVLKRFLFIAMENQLSINIWIVRHVKNLWNHFEQNCSLTQFITPEHELDKISAVECVLVFHGVKHSLSYRSQDCTVNLVRTQ